MQRLSRRDCLAALLGGSLAAMAFPTWAVANGQMPVHDPDSTLDDPFRVYNLRPRSWLELKRRNVVMQKYDYSCGAAALSTLFQYLWNDPITEQQILTVLFKILTLDEIKDRMKKGMAISDLRRVSVEMGYLSSIGTLTFDKLVEVKVPLIVPIHINESDHFVVYRGVACGRVYLADPIRGNVRPTFAEFCEQWKTRAILVAVKNDVEPPEQSALSIRQDEVEAGGTTEYWMNRELTLPPAVPPDRPGVKH